MPPLVRGGPGSGHCMVPSLSFSPMPRSFAEVPCEKADNRLIMAVNACRHTLDEAWELM